MKLQNITARHGRKKVLKNINLTLENEHQIIGILGPNGAGKTTFLNVVLGRLNTFKGKRNITETISYMPDHNFLYESMRVETAIKLFKDLYPDFDEKKAYSMLKTFNIDPKTILHDCSKGMHEQIHLTLILSRNTDFYILDEPLGAVDPLHREYLLKAIKEYRNPESSIIIVTHLVKDLESLFDRILIFNNGEIVYGATINNMRVNVENTEELYKRVLSTK